MDNHDRGDEPLILRLRSIIRFAVRVLAILMTAVILWGVVDVCWVLYQKLISPPIFLLTITDILATFGVDLWGFTGFPGGHANSCAWRIA